MLKNEYLLEVEEAGRAVAALAENERAFSQAVKAFESGDRDAFRQALDAADLLPHRHRICWWLCIWRCVRVCRLVCAELPTAAPSGAEIVELARRLAPLREDVDLLKRFVGAIDRGDAQTLGAIVRELEIERYCFFVCYWICSLRCRWFCVGISAAEQVAEVDPLSEIRDALEALAAVAKDEGALEAAASAYRDQDADRFRAILDELGILRRCLIVCRFFCYWHCLRLCLVLCREIPEIDLTIPELREFGLRLGKLGTRRGLGFRLYRVLLAPRQHRRDKRETHQGGER